MLKQYASAARHRSSRLQQAQTLDVINQWEDTRMELSSDAIVTALSILVATCVAWYQLQKQANDNAVQHTVNLLAQMFDDNIFSRQRAELSRIRRSGRTFLDDEVTADEDAAIIPVLNYYDFLSCLMHEGKIDPRITCVTLGGAIHADLDYLSGYVRARRIRLARPRLYENIFKADDKWFKHAD